MEWSEGGRKWDNCNSIINKYIKKKTNTTDMCHRMKVPQTSSSILS